MADQAYGEKVVKNDRLQVSVVAYDDGGTSEVFWSRSGDIIATAHEGSLLLHSDGSATFKCWSDADVPFVLHITGNRIVVAVDEDQPPNPEHVVFDSDTIKEMPR